MGKLIKSFQGTFRGLPKSRLLFSRHHVHINSYDMEAHVAQTLHTVPENGDTE